MLRENAIVKIVARVVVRSGRDRGEGDLFRRERLTGTIRAVTQRVREIRGADRWSIENRRVVGSGKRKGT